MLIFFAVGIYSLIWVNSNNSSYADIKGKETSMASEIEVVPESLVVNIPPSKGQGSKTKNQTFGTPLTVNLDTLWDKEDYWKDIVPGEVIIRYNTYLDIHKASTAELGITDKGIAIIDKGIDPLNFIVVKVSGNLTDMKNFMKVMKEKTYIKCIEPNRPMYILLTPNDTYYGQYQWDKPNINCPLAWDLGLGSMNISIAVIDHGTEYSHQDLQARYTTTKGYDFLDGDTDPIPGSTSENHGTHCSGVAAATINNGLGIAGVSNSHLYSLRVGNATTLNTPACVNAIQWCADNNINIVSMSWGNTVLVAEIDNVCRHADSAGCLLISATGNAGTTPMNYPAKLSQVMAVGAIDSANQRAQFSNYGAEMELVAPGVNIISTIPFGQYQAGWQGTSEACPQVSGAAALVWSANQTLTNHEVRAILDSTAADLGTAGWDQYYGYGKPNVYAAVQKALEMSGPRDTGIININNKSSASSNLMVSAITKTQNWILSISPTSFGVPIGGTKPVTVIVGGKFSTGNYRDTLWISSNDPAHNPYPVPVILKVAGVEDKEVVQDLFLQTSINLTQNQLIIRYAIPMNSDVKLKLYGASGRLIKSLIDMKQEPGNYSKNVNTNNLGNGVYFVVLRADRKQVSKKIILVK